MEDFEIRPLKNNLKKIFEIDIPASKSLSIRALILASIAKGNSKIRNFLKCDDTNNCIKALKALGILILEKEDCIEVVGCDRVFPIKSNKINFGSSGITSRFLVAIICASLSKNKNYCEITLDGSDQLRKRTIKPLVDTLISIGADIKYKEKDGFFPIIIKSAELKNVNNIEISGALSSQYVSAILMMSPLLKCKSKIKVNDINASNHPYIKMAIQTMKDFGITKINEVEKNIYQILPENYKNTNFTVEVDLNTASYFLAIGAVTNKEIKIKIVNKNSMQPAILFIGILKNMGCETEFKNNSLIFKPSKKLKGGFVVNMFSMAEMTTLLAVLGVFADKPIEIRGVAHIRNHESDRIKAISIELIKCGVKVKEFEDGLKVFPCDNLKNIKVETYEDHRIAMSLSVLGFGKNGLKIKNPSCVSKTCPEFFDLAEKLN